MKWSAAAWLISLITCTNASCYEGSKHVTSFGPTELYNLRNDQSDTLWLVQFYKGSDPEMANVSELYETAARSMEGFARLAALDVEKSPLTKLIMQLAKYPTYAYYSYYKYFPDCFDDFQTISMIHKEAAVQLAYIFEEKTVKRFVSDRNNYELGGTDIYLRLTKSLKAWAVVFYEAPSDACSKLAEDWNALVTAFKANIHFGSVYDPMVKVLPDQNVKYPVVKYYPQGYKKDDQPETYTGDMDYQSLFTFLEGKIVPPRIVQATEATIMMACLKVDYCVFTFLPKLRICDAKCRNKNLQTLAAAGKNHKLLSIVWMWNEFGEQPDIQGVFGLENCKHIVMVFLNMQTTNFSKVDTDVIKLEVVAKIFERRLADDTFTYTILDVPLPKIYEVKPWINPVPTNKCSKDEL